MRVAVRVVASFARPVLDTIVVGDCDLGHGAIGQTYNGAQRQVAFRVGHSKVRADGRRSGRRSRCLRDTAA